MDTYKLQGGDAEGKAGVSTRGRPAGWGACVGVLGGVVRGLYEGAGLRG